MYSEFLHGKDKNLVSFSLNSVAFRFTSFQPKIDQYSLVNLFLTTINFSVLFIRKLGVANRRILPEHLLGHHLGQIVRSSPNHRSFDSRSVIYNV